MKKTKKTVQRLLDIYEAKGVHFGIRDNISRLPGNRFRLEVKVLSETKIADIQRHANDVKHALKLDFMEVVEDGKFVHIIISKDLDKDEYLLKNILNNPAYIEMQKNMNLAIPIGVDSQGIPVAIDLADSRFPHICISGTSGSGKSSCLKSMLLTLSSYSPRSVNLIIGDKANDLSQFSVLPHLSYPLVEDFDTLLRVLLLLNDEMNRRLPLKNTSQMEQLPSILVLIDEFISFMDEAAEKDSLNLATDTLQQLLRRGRHAKIHLILVAHDPTKKNMRINTSDLPVKMVFHVSNVHNSLIALGEGGC